MNIQFMRLISSLLLTAFLLLTFSLTTAQSLETRLFELPDVAFKKVESGDDRATYEVMVKQYLDHKDPAKGTFYQKVYLSHVGYDRPTVIVTEGYNRPRNRVYELTKLLEANQVQVEHRYFGNSMPDSIDYNYLNLEQVTADLHRVNQLFRNLYQGKWVSTGISKGGSTTIIYRYFFPNDVDVSVPYVAPINREYEEQRIYDFLDKVGTKEVRNQILAFQKRLLKNREEILPLLHFYGMGARLKFTYLTEEEAFEYAVLEYPFSFWQWGGKAEEIPGKDADITTHVEHLLKVSNINFFADQSMTAFASHYYQAAQEMGYYGYETDDFKGLLKALPMKPYPNAAFTPNKMKVEFDGSLLDKVNKWLETEGNQFIYINGALDTWSATAVPENSKVDAHWFFMAGKDHGAARIRNMTDENREKVVSALEKWLSVKIDRSIYEKD